MEKLSEPHGVSVETVEFVIKAFGWSVSAVARRWERVGERGHTPPRPPDPAADGRHESVVGVMEA